MAHRSGERRSTELVPCEKMRVTPEISLYDEEPVMREVAIVSPVRTAVGNFGGGLKDIPAAELGATVIKAVLERTSLEPSKIDEVILGHGYPSGEEPAVGRLCALKAGLPIEVPGYQLD